MYHTAELGKFSVYLESSTIFSIQLRVWRYFSSEKGFTGQISRCCSKEQS